MIECEVTIRKWGNSFGVTLPKEVIEQNNLKENEKIKLLITKRFLKVKDVFGMGKGKIKIDSQKMKDEIREEERLAEMRHGK